MKFPYGLYKGWDIDKMVADEGGRNEALKYLDQKCKDPKFEGYMARLKSVIKEALERWQLRQEDTQREPILAPKPVPEPVFESPAETILVRLTTIIELLDMIKKNTDVVSAVIEKKKEKEYKTEGVDWE